MRLRLFQFIAAVCLLLVASEGWAQMGTTGRLQGVVTDPSGAAVAGARVIAAEKSTGAKREATTDDAGRYSLAALPAGEYTLTFEAAGFQQLVRSSVQVETAVSSSINAELKVGEVSEQVVVTEAAPLLNTTQATTFRQINTLELLEVPSSTRNFTHLLSAEAGVNSDLPPVLGNDTGSISPSVNGLRTTSNSLQFNGIDATNLLSNEGSLVENISPAPETIQEVKLQTSLYDATTGRNGGGNFQIVTRGGSNEFHGSAYWFVQNEIFNANDFFFNRDGIDKPAARRNEGGFTLGGPIVRDKMFIFGSYQRTQALTAFVSTGSAISDLPQGLDFVTGTRDAAGLLAAFNAARTACGQAPLAITVAPVAVNLFQLQNPATGNFVIPAPNRALDCSGGEAGLTQAFDAVGNPIVRVRQVHPSEFTQDQFTVRNDFNLSNANRLHGVFFFSNFPSLDSFPDPSSLASPFVLQRHNRARTLAVTDTHVFSPALVNEARLGLLFLNNTRSLDDPFLSDALTSQAVGIINPALNFDNSPGTRRLGHFIFRGPRFSFGGPNDSFNKRRQMTYSFTDTVSYQYGSHAMRFGFEFRHHNVANNLPEEQATEFEKIANFSMLLQGLTPEADTQYGVTDKEFTSRDLAWFVADDWRIGRKLTLNAGVRWDWFGWPTEKNGLLGNFDPTIANTENPIDGFLIPNNVNTTNLSTGAQAIIDPAVAATQVAGNKHTLRNQDLNNFQPRLGFAWQPLPSNRFVVRGGYGMFYDRPSAAFINTLFSNYPFLREIEVTQPSNNVPIATAFQNQNTSLPLNQFLPMRVVFRSNNYEMRDGTGNTLDAQGGNHPNCEPNGISMGGPCSGNIAETLEFRAVDRNLRTPYVQQWNLGYQWEVARDFMLEMRYVGTKGTRLLNALALAQSWDLNDPIAPDSVFQRLNDAYVRGGATRGALGSQVLTPAMTAACDGRAACLQGAGLAYGFDWPTGTGTGNQNFGALAGTFDLNLAMPTPLITNNTVNALIPFEPRAVFLGLNVPEAIILKSTGNSVYHGLQTNFTKRFSQGLQFNLGYTWSRSIDDSSADPGSTSGGGKPDVPNTGFIVQGDTRNTRANRGVSDFDRPHRFSLSFVYEIPTGGMTNQFVSGWQISGFAQAQSGAPYSIFSAEGEGRSASALLSLNNGPGGIYRLGFGRPDLAPGATLGDLTSTGDNTVAFDPAFLASPLGSFGNLPRNALRADMQKRFDVALSKSTRITERWRIEFRTEFFNIFNSVNFALPVNDLQDGSVGDIENTIGGPRVIQFGLRLVF